jgi:hypothetical protein
MPRHVKDGYEAAVYCNRRLPAVQARIEADIESALARRDFERAHRYALRLYLVEERFWTTVPCSVSTYNDGR